MSTPWSASARSTISAPVSVAALAPGLELVKDYGWLTILAKPLFWLLTQLHAFVGNWVPKDGPGFFVGEVSFEDAGNGKTKYTAKARHWTAEAKAQHERMGFLQGWEICARQLEALAKTL